MIKQIKSLLYFPIAYYFRFFAQIQLIRWMPRIIVITGSSGKTTLLHLIESQLQEKARYSHYANSSYGIPFNILGLQRKDLTLGEWPYLFFAAPFKAFKKPPKEKLYVVEADCDRPNEGKFLANLLKPEVTLWTGVGRTHTVSFDKSVTWPNRHSDKRSRVRRGEAHPESPSFRRDSGQVRMMPTQFSSVENAIAYEFGYFLEATSKLAIVNTDSVFIGSQMKRSKAKIKNVSQKNTDCYNVFKNHTKFKINGKIYLINNLLPREASLSIQMTLILLDYLKIKPDYSFSKFSLPPGRCSSFKGIKSTTLIDSSYNATPDGMKSILEMFNQYPSRNKWLVLGDMIELGSEEQEEHEKLADIISTMKLDKIILVGPRLAKYTYPKLKNAECFIMPKEALDYLLNNIQGGEVILFKGARFLEGVIEHLLADKNDVNKLCRREKIWQERREKWEL